MELLRQQREHRQRVARRLVSTPRTTTRWGRGASVRALEVLSVSEDAHAPPRRGAPSIVLVPGRARWREAGVRRRSRS
jgi:hypothetical protein